MVDYWKDCCIVHIYSDGHSTRDDGQSSHTGCKRYFLIPWSLARFIFHVADERTFGPFNTSRHTRILVFFTAFLCDRQRHLFQSTKTLTLTCNHNTLARNSYIS